MLSFKATAAVFDVIGSCYWLVAITWAELFKAGLR